MEVFLCDPEIWKPCKVTLGNRRRSFPLAWLVGQDIPILDFYKAHCVHGQWLSHVQLFATTWIVARQASLSIRFSRQEYWSGLPFPSPGDLPDLGIEHVSLASPALAGVFFTSEPPGKPQNSTCILQIQVITKAKLLIFFMFYTEMSFFYLFSTYQLYFSINYITNGIYWSGKNESTILTSQSLIH